jgi:hypothetical protein
MPVVKKVPWLIYSEEGADQVLDALLNTFMSPQMTAAGFRRTGRRFTAEAENRNAVVVEVRPYSLADAVAFHIEWSPIPCALRIYYAVGSEKLPDERELDHGLFIARLQVPDDLRVRPLFTNLWTFDSAALNEFGPRFQACIDEALVCWRRSLDPAQLISLEQNVRSLPDTSPTGHGGVFTRLWVEIDSADPSELDRLLQEQETRLPDDPDVHWLRARLDRRIAQLGD